MNSSNKKVTNDNARKGDASGGVCPVCKAAPDAKYLPFCSRRCADVDLHRWLSGGYAIPAVESDDDQGLPDAE
jgi:hypothetical protein